MAEWLGMYISAGEGHSFDFIGSQRDFFFKFSKVALGLKASRP